MQVGLMVGNESLPLCFLDLRHNNNPKVPNYKKHKNIKPSLDRLGQRHMTKKLQGNKKITKRKIQATNNKFLARTGSLHFFRKYNWLLQNFGLYRYRYATVWYKKHTFQASIRFQLELCTSFVQFVHFLYICRNSMYMFCSIIIIENFDLYNRCIQTWNYNTNRNNM